MAITGFSAGNSQQASSAGASSGGSFVDNASIVFGNSTEGETDASNTPAVNSSASPTDIGGDGDANAVPTTTLGGGSSNINWQDIGLVAAGLAIAAFVFYQYKKKG
jgi:hypothetical protein